MSKRTPKNKKTHRTLLLCYVDTRIFLEAISGNGYRFIPKGGTFPTENQHACCEKHIAKPAPNGKKIVPRHVDAAP